MTLILAAKGPLIAVSRTTKNRLRRIIHQLQIFVLRTPDLITAQLDWEQCESDEAPGQQTAPSPADPAKVKPTDAMVDPLQVLLAAVPVALGSTTVTEEED